MFHKNLRQGEIKLLEENTFAMTFDYKDGFASCQASN